MQQPENQSSDHAARYLLPQTQGQVEWNLGGMFTFDAVLTRHLSLYADVFGYDAPPVSISGAPPCIWSLSWFEPSRSMSVPAIRETLDSYPAFGVPVYFLFDNRSVTENELKDSLGNGLLAWLEEHNESGKNGVYVASDVLALYIMKHYPTLTVKACVNRMVDEGRRDADFYNCIAEAYHGVALHPLDVFDDDLLGHLEDFDRFEITVNDTCFNTCPCRREHMILLDLMRREPFNVDLVFQLEQCYGKAGCRNVVRPEGTRPLSLARGEFDRFVGMGFGKFRLQAESLQGGMAYAHYLVHWLYKGDEEVLHKRGLLAARHMIDSERPKPAFPSGIGEYRTTIQGRQTWTPLP